MPTMFNLFNIFLSLKNKIQIVGGKHLQKERFFYTGTKQLDKMIQGNLALNKISILEKESCAH